MMERFKILTEDLYVKRGQNVILRNINLSIPSGELTVIIGPNGSGKTTLLKALIGDIPYKGTVRYTNDNGLSFKPRIGYVPQKLEFDPGSPVSVLDFIGSSYARVPVWFGHSRRLKERVRNNLARVGAEHLVHRPLGQLSGGELQRVLLALALDPMPDILLLDEPFSAIDQNSLEKYYELAAGLVSESGLSVLLVSHDFDLAARYAKRMLFLNQSIEVFGTPGEVLDHERFQLAFRQYTNRKPGILTGYAKGDFPA